MTSSLFLVSAGIVSFSQAAPIPSEKINTTIQGAIQYLSATQEKTGKGKERLAGEWPSFMMNDRKALMLGAEGKTAYDSNCFTTAAIYNSLAYSYLKNPELRQIPELLSHASHALSQFKEGDRYGFWLKFDGLRRPNHYELDNNFVKNASNVPVDADDTATAYLTHHYQEKIFGTPLPRSQVGDLFSEYIDKKRKSLHYYNVINGWNVRTKAFLTWHQKEKLWTPWSWAPIGHKKPYIPYGANEVDCVVNANVLTTLAAYGEINAKPQLPGVEGACKLVNRAVAKNNFGMCGLYYPNSFHFPYAMAKAVEAGADCLKPSVAGTIQFLVNQQKPDGRFLYKPKGQKLKGKIVTAINSMQKAKAIPYDDEMGKPDPTDSIQSTAYALNALVTLGGLSDPKIRSVVEKGLDYLLSQATIKNSQGENQKISWKGGIFFAGGTLVREDIVWRSDAYTTALIVELLTKYQASSK